MCLEGNKWFNLLICELMCIYDYDACLIELNVHVGPAWILGA